MENNVMKLPYFCKSENGKVFYKLLNIDGCFIQVANYHFNTSIEFSKTANEKLIFAKGNKEIKESEFNEAFNQVLEALKTKITK